MHAAGSSDDGISDDLIRAVLHGTWRDHPELDASEHLGLEYAEHMTATPPTINDQFLERLTAAFDDPTIVNMMAIIAWENYRARLNVGLGVEGHDFYKPGRPEDE